MNYDNIDESSGHFYHEDIYGTVDFRWSANIITLKVENNHISHGSFACQRLTLNEAELESFHYCLRKWQALQQHLKNGNKLKDFVFE